MCGSVNSSERARRDAQFVKVIENVKSEAGKLIEGVKSEREIVELSRRLANDEVRRDLVDGRVALINAQIALIETQRDLTVQALEDQNQSAERFVEANIVLDAAEEAYKKAEAAYQAARIGTKWRIDQAAAFVQ